MQAAKQALSHIARPTLAFAGGLAGQSAAVQFGPWAVNKTVDIAVNGAFSRFATKQLFHLAFGSYYAPVGQLLVSTAIMIAPEPGPILTEIKNRGIQAAVAVNWLQQGFSFSESKDGSNIDGITEKEETSDTDKSWLLYDMPEETEIEEAILRI